MRRPTATAIRALHEAWVEFGDETDSEFQEWAATLGFEYWDCGANRIVMRSGNWVVKFNIDNSGDWNSNRAEWKNILEIRKSGLLGNGLSIPETHLVECGDDCAIVMQFVEGYSNFDSTEKTDAWIGVRQIAKEFGLLDLMTTNIITEIKTGEVFLVDLEC